MKRITTSILVLLTFFLVQAQNVNIPDANFKAYLVGNSAINTNGDNEIQVIEAQAFTGIIDCNSMNITDLTGIEAFTSLTQLHCYSNPITSIDLSSNVSLTSLVCAYTLLTSLDLSNNLNLVALNCSYCQLASLDLSNNSALSWLHCRNNNLTSLNVTNTVLTELQCETNQIASLDVSGISTLVEVICNNNQIPVLDFSSSTGFIKLLANNNQLTTLNLRNGNNTNVVSIGVNGNPNLTCVEVDDADYSLTTWGIGIGADFAFMAGVTFSESCSGGGGSSSIIEDFSIMEFSIYPNPANDFLYITDLIEGASVSIFDLNGREVFTGISTSGQMTVDVSNLIFGIYMIRVVYKDEPFTKRLIVR